MPLQMGKCCARQNVLSQVLHVAPESLDEEEWVESGMMVLFLKQVHLQNKGGAGDVSIFHIWGGGGDLTSCQS